MERDYDATESDGERYSSSTKFHFLQQRWIETCHCDKCVVVCLGKNEWQETPVAVTGTWKLETDIRDAIVINVGVPWRGKIQWVHNGGLFNTEIWRIILQSKRKMVASWPSIFTLNIILTDHPTLCRLNRGNCRLATSWWVVTNNLRIYRWGLWSKTN